jgi:hypothetical protein
MRFFVLRTICNLMRNLSTHVTDKKRDDMAMCKGCLGLVYQSTKEVQPHAGLKEEGAFSHLQGVLHILVCTDKKCGTRWERLLRSDGFGARHVWKVRSE